MRMLIINGSPRGEQSSTLRLTKSLTEGLRREGDKVDVVDISKHEIQGCRGCFGCWASGGKCVIKDDFFEIFKERHLPSELPSLFLRNSVEAESLYRQAVYQQLAGHDP